jgi:centromeric protein E
VQQGVRPQSGSLAVAGTAYTYDRVFATADTTDAVYDAAARKAVLSSAQGYNCTVFAYGQTGSGKTYTMRGVMAAAAGDLFGHIAETPGRDFSIRCSALEIYNEEASMPACY